MIIMKPAGFREPALQDAHPIVDQAIRQGNIETLKRDWLAHQHLKVETSEEPIHIERHVINMLEHQAKQGQQLGEIPLFFMMVPKDDHQIVRAVWQGNAGEYGSVKFGGMDPHFRNALGATLSHGGTMPLGHTHPRGYGPIFSHVTSEDVGEDGRESADYNVAMTFEPFTHSPYHLMVAMNPRNGKPTLGVLEVKKGHKVGYHPWKCINPKSE